LTLIYTKLIRSKPYSAKLFNLFMAYLYLKSLHIIFVVTWFSGMFYLVRLFVYNCETNEKNGENKAVLHEQFSIMISRLYWAITLPSAIITLVLGLALLHYFLPMPNWLMIKLFFVLILFLYQISLHILTRQHIAKVFKYTSQQMRLWNEVPTIILVAIVFLVVMKNTLSMMYGIIGLIAFMILIFAAIRIYKNLRKN